jgi:hypothetical protein
MKNRHQSNQKSGAKGDLPNWIVHAAPPVALLHAERAGENWLLSPRMVRYWQKGAGMSKANSCGLGKTGDITTLVGAGIHLLPTPGANFRPGQASQNSTGHAGNAFRLKILPKKSLTYLTTYA